MMNRRSTEPRDCPHHTAHRHGTRAAYVADHCGCPACVDANTAALTQRRRLLAYGTWRPLADPKPAADRVRALRAAGLTTTQIARLAKVSRSTVQLLHENATPERRIRPATLDAIAGLPLPVDLAS